MSIVPISYYLVLSAILFGLGIVAFVFKRNIITIFMAIELMLSAVIWPSSLSRARITSSMAWCSSFS